MHKHATFTGYQRLPLLHAIDSSSLNFIAFYHMIAQLLSHFLYKRCLCNKL
jgi:hypothetical protein